MAHEAIQRQSSSGESRGAVRNGAVRNGAAHRQGLKRPGQLSIRYVLGFACNQAFLFALFYLGVEQPLEGFASGLMRHVLVFILLSMAATMGILRLLQPSARDALFSRPALFLAALLAAFGGAVVLFLMDGLAVVRLGFVQIAILVALGASCAVLLAAWGKTLGAEPISRSVPEVFIGSLIAAVALVCVSVLRATLSNRTGVMAAFYSLVVFALVVLPLVSMALVRPRPMTSANTASMGDADQENAAAISVKILAGTLLFGVAAGCVDAYSTVVGKPQVAYVAVAMVLFAAFAGGALSLQLSDGFGKGLALNKSYRLAVFILVLGALACTWPALSRSALPGEAIVLAGYLGLEAVLAALFLVMAKITGSDAALGFADGFASLFGGEMLGVLLSNVLRWGMGPDSSFVIAILAGAAALLSYIFLFTERDFDALSQIADKNDSFEDACARIAEQFGLSKREAEILPFALRGRTAERIAGELVITKSTVDTHLRRIYGKCGVHSRQELIDLGEQFL